LPNNPENGIARSINIAAGLQTCWLHLQDAEQSSSFNRTEGTEVRTTMILPPNLYSNMNATSILKNRAARHVAWTNRYTHGAGACWQDEPSA
jgi:hypothetical protein